jgi:uncharacterized protein YdhG (YjbR/CyaY superfamily)
MRRTGARPTTAAEYVAGAPPDKRAALNRLRRTIKAAAPGAIEGIGYGLVGYKYKGRPLVYVGYAKEHCALYGGALTSVTPQLRDYDVSKGTIRFQPAKPLPDRLVTRIVKDRMAEIERAASPLAQVRRRVHAADREPVADALLRPEALHRPRG